MDFIFQQLLYKSPFPYVVAHFQSPNDLVWHQIQTPPSISVCHLRSPFPPYLIQTCFLYFINCILHTNWIHFPPNSVVPCYRHLPAFVHPVSSTWNIQLSLHAKSNSNFISFWSNSSLPFFYAWLLYLKSISQVNNQLFSQLIAIGWLVFSLQLALRGQLMSCIYFSVSASTFKRIAGHIMLTKWLEIIHPLGIHSLINWDNITHIIFQKITCSGWLLEGLNTLDWDAQLKAQVDIMHDQRSSRQSPPNSMR